MFPQVSVLLEYYYGTIWAAPWAMLSILAGLAFFYFLGHHAGSRETLRYVWNVGLPHTQKEHRDFYLKCKNKIKD